MSCYPNSYYSYYAYPCATACQPSQCNSCPVPCTPCNSCDRSVCNLNNSCAVPTPCPAVSYITTITSNTTVPTSTASAALPQYPSNTTILAYNTPTTNVGCIVLNGTTGRFTVPIAGRYSISAFIGFLETATTPVVGQRLVDLVRVDASTNTASVIVSDSRNATSYGPTYTTLSTIVDLRANDSILVSVAQNSGSVVTLATNSRLAISRIC